MNIIVSTNDKAALNFVQHVLPVRELRRDHQQVEFFISGGGTLPVQLRTAHGDELGKGPYAISRVTNAHAWGDRVHVEVVVNTASPKLPDHVRGLLGQMMAESKGWRAPKSVRGRGGSVVFEELAYTGRIVEPEDADRTNVRSKIFDLPPNRFLRAACGVSDAPVKYGTTDAANVFELLQVLKAGHLFDRPVVFDSYDQAHTVSSFWQRVVQPSLMLLNSDVIASHYGLDPTGKFTQPMQPGALKQFFGEHCKHIADRAVEAAYGQSMASWYRLGMNLLVARIQSMLETNVKVHFMAAERCLEQLPQWRQPLYEHDRRVMQYAKGPVILYYDADGQPYRATDWRRPFQSMAELHQQGGWLGGASIYHLVYSMGMGGGLIYLVKDGSLGNVHRQAIPYLDDPMSQLYLLPTNLFRLHAAGQDQDASIDPWVMLELLEIWGPHKSYQHLRQIWDFIEVPLRRSHVGRETRVAISLDGLAVRVLEP